MLDRWCDTEVTPRPQGNAPLIRSCDDVIIGVAREDDARRVRAVLGKRLGRFGLALHPDKTRLLPFGRPPQTQQRGKSPATFACVGCTFYWRRPRKGHWRMGCKTRRASLRRAKTSLDDWCRRHRHLSMEEQHAARNRRGRGHCNSCGVSGNSPSLRRLVEATKRAWYKWLRRRSQGTRLNWERLTERLRWWPLPRPRITVRIWDGSPRATSAEEPEGGNLLVRIWRGAELGNHSAYSTMLRHAPEGLSRTAISDNLGRNRKAGAIGAALERLLRRHLARMGSVKTEDAKRPTEVWYATHEKLHSATKLTNLTNLIQELPLAGEPCA